MNLKLNYRRSNIKPLATTALLLLTSSLSVQAADELLFVLGVSRHGARSPQAIMPFNSTPANFENTSNLLAAGFFQHRDIGKILKGRLVDEYHLIPDYYSQSDIFVQATDINRTQESAKGQLYGLYPANTEAVHDWVSAGSNATGYNYTFVPAE